MYLKKCQFMGAKDEQTIFFWNIGAAYETNPDGQLHSVSDWCHPKGFRSLDDFTVGKCLIKYT